MSLVGGYSQPYATDALYPPYYAARFDPHSAVPDPTYFSTWSFGSGGTQSPDMSPTSTEYSPPPPFATSPGQQPPPPLHANGGVTTATAAGVGGGSGAGIHHHHHHHHGGVVTEYTTITIGVRGERVVKRRVTANKKERRRTQSINNAFAELRDCIPNVPADTKLSKIKTLRLATSYIAYLMDLLAQDDPSQAPEGGFKAELSKKLESREERRKKEIATLVSGVTGERRSKGRTGWPQHVWALELKHDQ